MVSVVADFFADVDLTLCPLSVETSREGLFATEFVSEERAAKSACLG
jgi:hypothetical protein